MKIISKRNVCIFSLGLIPMLNQLNTSIISIGELIYLPFVLIAILMIGAKKVSVFSKKILCIFIIIQVVIPLVSLGAFRLSLTQGIYSMVLNSVAFLEIIFLGNYDNTTLGLPELNSALLVGNSPILVFNIVMNINQLSVNNLKYLFVGERDTRVLLGFANSNWLGMYAFMEIVLIYLFFKTQQNIKNSISLCLKCIFALSLLAIISSGSRTAFIQVILFIVLEISRMLLTRIKMLNVLYFIHVIYFIVIVMVVFNEKLLAGYISGRDILNQNIISYLSDNNYLLLGISCLNVTALSNYVVMTDCWYIVCIAQIGILGLCGWFIIIFILYRKLIFTKNIIGASLLLCLCSYGITENVIFNVGVSMSIVFLIIIAFMANSENFREGKL